MVVHEQALLALDRADKPRPTPESSRQGLHHGGGRAASREAVRELRSRPQSRGDLGGAPLLFTGRHECEHGHEHLHELAGRPFYLWAGMSARFLRSLLQEKGIPELPPPEHSLAYRRPTGGGS